MNAKLQKSFSLFLILAIALTLIGAAGYASAAKQASGPAPLLQFTAGSHVLGFDARSVYVASGDHALRVEFARANEVQPQADAASADGEAASLGRVVYAELWDGISLEYASLADGIYFTTYTLAPGANVRSIRLRYNTPVTLNADGSLTVSFERGSFTESAPIAWQEIRGQRVPVDVKFRARGQEVGFALGAYDPDYALMIDPALVWNTFLGGSDMEMAYGIGRDASGNVYVAGSSAATWSSPVRAYTAGFDAFVAKLDSNGALIWNTFLGGSGTDYAWDISIAGSEVWVVGDSTATWGSPVNAYSASSRDAFAAKLVTGTGALTWNTFLGGSGEDHGRGISYASPGYVYVAGKSSASWGSPVRAYTAGVDAFAAKLSYTGTLTWNTFLGGSGNDEGQDIHALDAYAIYVTGFSNAAWGSPVRAYTSPGIDAFVVSLGNTGTLTWNTFLGGSGSDYGDAITVHTASEIYVTGESSSSWGSPLHSYTAGTDAFAAKMNASGALTWNTFLGGSAADTGHGITTDPSGDVYITGTSSATWLYPKRPHSGDADAFVAKLSSSGWYTSNSFLGGAGYDEGRDIAVDSSENPYVTGFSLSTWGSPVRAYTASSDGFAAKADLQSPTVTSISLLDSNPTNDASVDFDVYFSEDVTGVDASDFGIYSSGLSSVSISGVSGSGSAYTVTVNTGTGNGTLQLRVVGGAIINDLGGNLVTGLPYTSGPTYTVDKTAPTAVVITRADPNPTSAASVDFTVIFSEPVTGVGVSDFTLTTTGVSGASVTSVGGSGAAYWVTVNTGSGSGTIRLDVTDDDSIQDGAGNPLGGTGAGNGNFTAGDAYTVQKSKTYRSTGTDDGWTLESTETSGVGGSANSSATTFNLGDGTGDKQYRSILSFNTSSLPDTAVITKVTLKIKKQGLVGTDPFTLLGLLRVDIRKPFFGSGAGLANGDFQAAAGKSNIGSIPNTPVSNWYSKTWTTDTFFSFINLTGTTQFRLRFATDDNNDNGADYMKFYSGNYAGLASRPTLVIEYYVP